MSVRTYVTRRGPQVEQRASGPSTAVAPQRTHPENTEFEPHFWHVADTSSEPQSWHCGGAAAAFETRVPQSMHSNVSSNPHKLGERHCVQRGIRKLFKLVQVK